LDTVQFVSEMVIIEQITMNKVRSTKLLLPIFDPIKIKKRKRKNRKKIQNTRGYT